MSSSAYAKEHARQQAERARYAKQNVAAMARAGFGTPKWFKLNEEGAKRLDAMRTEHSQRLEYVRKHGFAPPVRKPKPQNPVVIGPHGGVYEVSATGKKHSIGHHNLQGHGGLKHR